MVRSWHGRSKAPMSLENVPGSEVERALSDLDAISPELAMVVAEFQEDLREDTAFASEASWWRHVECRFALRCLLLHLEENLETAALRIESKTGGSVSQWRKVQVMAQLSKAFEATTEPRLSKSHSTPRGVQVEKRYNLKASESELFRLLVVRESATSRLLCRFLSSHSGSDVDSALCSLCHSSKLDVQAFLQEKRQYVTEGIIRIQEPSVSPEAVHALLGKELTTEQRLKLSSTAIDAVIKGDDVETDKRDEKSEEKTDKAEKVEAIQEMPETTTEGQQDSVTSESAEDESEFQQPYKDSLDYLNDQFSL
eukprot:symbB.v1.2.026231.t1/scaffold2605.1/size75065/2